MYTDKHIEPLASSHLAGSDVGFPVKHLTTSFIRHVRSLADRHKCVTQYSDGQRVIPIHFNWFCGAQQHGITDIYIFVLNYIHGVNV